jgi:hypothetical protein
MAKKESIKLSDKEIQSIKELQQENAQINSKLGLIVRQKWALETRIKQIREEELIAYSKKEKEILTEINNIYGDGKLDLDTFEFIKSEN